MKSINEMRTELSDVFVGVRNGTISTKKAAELANIAGKMISSAKVQIEYYALRKEAPVIKFLQSDDAPSQKN
jgi:hypothetical protein